MAQGRDFRPRLGDLLRVDFGADDAGLLAAVGQHAPPRIDNQGMTVGLTVIGMIPTLRWGKDITTGLHGAGA